MGNEFPVGELRSLDLVMTSNAQDYTYHILQLLSTNVDFDVNFGWIVDHDPLGEDLCFPLGEDA